MDSMTPYPPMVRAPLRMRGIFGIAWQLYKRRFFPMFLVSLLLIGLPILLMMLPYFSILSPIVADLQNNFSQFGQFSSLSPEVGLQQVSAMLRSLLVIFLVLPLFTFLLGPMYTGAVYLEMEERMEGRAGTLGQLFRYALPIGLKRFYTTFLALLVVQLGVSMVVSLINTVGIFGSMFSIFPSLNSAPNIAVLASFFIPMGIVMLLTVLISFCASAFMALVYPVAAHEQKFAFSAVGRAFKLAAKRFWRVLGVMVLCSLVVGVISWVLCLPALLLWRNMEAMFVLLSVLTAFVGALASPYTAAFYTALYVDIAARVDGPEYSVIDPDSVPDPDPDELRDGPRTL